MKPLRGRNTLLEAFRFMSQRSLSSSNRGFGDRSGAFVLRASPRPDLRGVGANGYGGKAQGNEKEETGLRSGAVNFERRKHPRFSIDLPIEYWQLDKSKSRLGRTIDVSEGGLLLHLPEPMDIGQVLGLTIFITSGPDLSSIEALTQVQIVWKDTHGEKYGDYRVGVKLIEISQEDMGKLKNLLNTPMNLKTSSG